MFKIAGLLLVCLLWMETILAAPVTMVNVSIRDEAGKTSPVLLRKMEDSMQVVAAQLFNGRDSGFIAADTAGYERLLSEISDRVITGYQTNRVVLSMAQEQDGTAVNLAFAVAPWAQTVQKVDVDIQFSGINPFAAAVLQEKVPALRELLQKTLQGASLDAADWAGGILRGQVKNSVEAVLPDFKAAVDLTTRDDTVTVQVIIYPVGELVRNVQYSMVSKSIPNILLMKLKYKYADKAKSLQGLPVSYLEADQKILTDRLMKELSAEPQVVRHHLTPQVVIRPGAETQLDISLESNKYKIWFEGYGDVGRKDRNLSGRAHLGRFFSRRDELFGEVGIDLKDVRWDFSVGYAYHWGKSTLSYMRRVPADANLYRLEYDFTPKWRFRYEHFGDTKVNEYAIRYRIHEFLSGEYVYSTKKSYFRIVGNL
jgi:predicted component of type VI protein secretion system